MEDWKDTEEDEACLRDFTPTEGKSAVKTIIVPRSRILWAFHDLVVFLKWMPSGFSDIYQKKPWHPKAAPAETPHVSEISGCDGPCLPDCRERHLEQVRDLKDAEYQVVAQVAATGHRLAGGITRLSAPVDTESWPTDRKKYRDYLDAQSLLFEGHPELMSISAIEDFMMVAARYLQCSLDQEGVPDFRYRPTVSALRLKFDQKAVLVDDNGCTIANILTAMAAYRDLQDNTPSKKAVRNPRELDDLNDLNGLNGLNEMDEPGETGDFDLLEGFGEPGKSMDDPLMDDPLMDDGATDFQAVPSSNTPSADNDAPDVKPWKKHKAPQPTAVEPDPQSSEPSEPCWLYPVSQTALPLDELNKKWIEAGELAIKQPFKVSGPLFFKADKPEQIMAGLRKWRADLDADFPHFGEVTRYFYGQLLIAAEGGSVPHFAPVLLLGDPGIGKTTYMRHLALHLNIPFATQSLANVSGGFVLTGSDPTWKSSKAGWLAKTFMELHTLNPIFMLDEIDKASTSVGGAADHNNNVQEVLLSLLESETSERFVDEYLSHLEMNLSHVSFIGTANNLSTLSDPLLSRFQIMEVRVPSRIERQKIIQSVYERMVERMELKDRFSPLITGDMLDAMLNNTGGNGNLRDLHGTLRTAIGNALIRVRESSAASSATALTDLPITLCVLDMPDRRSTHSIGFL